MIYRLTNYFVIISIFIIVTYIIYILIFFKSGSQITNPLLLWILDIIGLHIINNHPIAKQFHQYLFNIMDYNRKLFIVLGQENANIGILTSPHGIVLNQIGVDSFISIDWKTLYNINTWNLFIKLLSCYRKSLPCNGILLLLSLSDMQQDLIETVTSGLAKLSKNFSYPIYIVFYDLELLSGFQSFIKILNNSDKNMIIGWSNSNSSMDKINFSISHVNLLVQQINNHIFTKLNQLIDSNQIKEGLEEIYMLPYQISEYINTNLEIILNKLFYNDLNYTFRGVYFSGKHDNTQLFIQNLINSLIIKDNLATTNIYYKTRYSSILRRGIIIALLVLIMFIPLLYKKLISKVDNNLSSIIAMERILNKGTINTYIRFQTLIHNIDIITQSRLKSILIPVSWFSGIDKKINKLINKIYSKVILEEIYNHFNSLLSNAANYNNQSTDTDFSEYSILNSKEFIELYNYIQHISTLNKLYQSISSISKTPSLNNFAYVFKELYQKDLPQLFYKHLDIYNNSIKYISGNLHDINQSKYDLQATLFNKINAFASTVNNLRDIKTKLDTINQNLTLLQDNPTQYNGVDMVNILNLFNQLKSCLNDPKYKWINLTEFDGGIHYNQVLDTITNSGLFGIQCANHLKHTINTSLKNARLMLDQYKMPVFGQTFEMKNNNYTLSQSILQFILIIEELNSNKLINTEEIKANLDTKLTEYTWNLPRIANIISIISSFEDYIKQKIDMLPISSRGYINQIILNALQRKIEVELMLSCDTSALVINKSFYEVQVQNLNKAKPTLLQIINFLHKSNLSDLSRKLQEMLIQQSNVILQELYNILDRDQVYIIDNRFFMNQLLTPKMLFDLIQSNHIQFMNLTSKAVIILELMDDLYKLDVTLVKSGMYQTWKDLISYTTPGSTLPLDELESFFNKLLSCKNILELTNALKNIRLSTEDFIRQRQITAINTANGLIKLNAVQEFESLYPTIVEQFNLYLKSYFPFADLQSPDLPKENAVKFDEFWSNIRDRMDRLVDILSTEDKYKDIITFTKNLSKSMKWISAMLRPGKQQVSLNIKIRDCISLEKNVNQLSKWVVAFGSKSTYAIEDQTEAQIVQCEMNNDITLSSINQITIDFAQRIAQGSKFRFNPGSDPDQLIQGMSYNSNFSLLRMLARYFDHQDNNTIYLKFQFKLIDENTKELNELISWISVKLNGLEYQNFAQPIRL